MTTPTLVAVVLGLLPVGNDEARTLGAGMAGFVMVSLAVVVAFKVDTLFNEPDGLVDS